MRATVATPRCRHSQEATMLSELHKATIHAIVNIFETGEVFGDYGKVTLLAGDTGHLTYGRSQTTLASGNLHLLISAYCREPEAALAAELAGFLPRLALPDLSLDHDQRLRGLLRAAGDDPVMWQVQDGFFDRVYWAPALTSAAFIGLAAPLAHAVVYDSRIHGSWHMIRDRTTLRHGPPAAIGETAWTERYVAERHAWLANHSNRLLRNTVYRTASFRKMIDDGAWALPLPLEVRGHRLEAAALLAGRPLRVSADEVERRILRLRHPFMRGEEVRLLQQSLAAAGHALEPDGVFGPATERAVIAFQHARGLVADGIAGPATWAALGLD
jgi:chitosanase